MEEAAFDANQFLPEQITSCIRLFHLVVADLTLIAAALWILALGRFLDIMKRRDAQNGPPTV